jgi:hypothetical protein
MDHDDINFIGIVCNQEPNLNDQLFNAFLQLKGSVDYIATWIEDFHNTDVYDGDDEKLALLATFTKIRHIMEDEIQ